MALFDVITIGDMCVDLIVDLGDARPRFGQTEQWVPDYLMELGGSTCIFASQAAKLGLRVAVLGRVGDDAPGKLALARLAESGVDTRYVTVDPALKTGLGLALCRADGDRAILTYPGSVNAVHPEDVTDDFLRSGRHLHYGAYYLQTNLLPAAPELLAHARGLGLTVSLDTNWDPSGTWDSGLRRALRATDLFLPNEKEAVAISGGSDAVEAAAILAGWGPVVAVKLGDLGSLVVAGREAVIAEVQPVREPIDTIGAGDSYDAGFITAWLNGRRWGECAALGNACGRASTLARGGIEGQLRAADLAGWRG